MIEEDALPTGGSKCKNTGVDIGSVGVIVVGIDEKGDLQ